MPVRPCCVARTVKVWLPDADCASTGVTNPAGSGSDGKPTPLARANTDGKFASLPASVAKPPLVAGRLAIKPAPSKISIDIVAAAVALLPDGFVEANPTSATAARAVLRTERNMSPSLF
jgi:hypothetical protein